ELADRPRSTCSEGSGRGSKARDMLGSGFAPGLPLLRSENADAPSDVSLRAVARRMCLHGAPILGAPDLPAGPLPLPVLQVVARDAARRTRLPRGAEVRTRRGGARPRRRRGQRNRRRVRAGHGPPGVSAGAGTRRRNDPAAQAARESATADALTTRSS